MPVLTEADHKGDLQAKQSQDNKDSKDSKGGKISSTTDRIAAAVAQAAHNSNPGPVIADKMPEAANKDELKKRGEELNQS